MNDRFKFRFWNGRTMIYDDIPHLELYNCDDYIWMQCTGLKDKNGKLIFEGDVVKHDLVKCDIVYDDYSFMAHVWLADDIVPLTELTDDFGNCPFNVIGNIYENPELLKECE